MPRPSAAGAQRGQGPARRAPQGSSRSIAPRRCESSAPRPSSVRLAMPTLRAGRTRTRPSARGCAGEYHRIGLKRAVPDRTGRYDARRVVVGGSPERPHVDHPRSTTVPAENLTRAEAHGRAAVVQVESYDVVLDLTTGPDTFASTTVVRFDATPGARTFIDLIAPRVHTVELNGRDLDVAGVVADSRIALADLELGVQVHLAVHRVDEPVQALTGGHVRAVRHD